MSVEERLHKLEERVSKIEQLVSKIVEEAPKKAAKEPPYEEIRELLIRKYGKIYEKEFICLACYTNKFGWNLLLSPKDALGVDARRVSSVSEALANEYRVKILRALYEKSRTSKELSDITGLEGGQLYHHLRILTQNRFVVVGRRGEYSITVKGATALMVLSALAKVLVPPPEEELEKPLSRVQVSMENILEQ